VPKKKDTLSEEGIKSIEGIIIPVRWDDDGNSTAIALATSQEEEFFINMKSAKGKKLLEYLQKKVRITGSVTTLDNNQKMITIKKCHPISYDELFPHNIDGKIPQ
jgi:hypothetical protein